MNRTPLPDAADAAAATKIGKDLETKFDKATAADPADTARRYGKATTDSKIVFGRNITAQPLCEWLHGESNVIPAGRIGRVFAERLPALKGQVEPATEKEFEAQGQADEAARAARGKKK